MADIIYNRIRVAVLKPVDMLGSDKKGEKEPKAKWFMAILGVICIGIGYYLANTINNPIEALSVFLVAVLFVIAGTYFAFTGLSIVLLKMLKNNKNSAGEVAGINSIGGTLFSAVNIGEKKKHDAIEKIVDSISDGIMRNFSNKYRILLF